MVTIKRRGVQVTALAIALILMGWAWVFEPVTRQWIATDSLCGYCHVDREYRSDVRLSFSVPHPALDDAATTASASAAPAQQAGCVECHLAPGFINAIYAYTHFASLTDLFGHFRDRMSERAGVWIPARQAAAYRVRDRLFEQDSPTCRGCHLEQEIEPKRVRGKNAHQKALDEQMTCIECHYNEKHRSVDLRANAFVTTTES